VTFGVGLLCGPSQRVDRSDGASPALAVADAACNGVMGGSATRLPPALVVEDDRPTQRLRFLPRWWRSPGNPSRSGHGGGGVAWSPLWLLRVKARPFNSLILAFSWRRLRKTKPPCSVWYVATTLRLPSSAIATTRYTPPSGAILKVSMTEVWCRWAAIQRAIG